MHDSYHKFNRNCVIVYSVSQDDVDRKGSIDYLEFISATMHRYRFERDEHIFTRHFSILIKTIVGEYCKIGTTLSEKDPNHLYLNY